MDLVKIVSPSWHIDGEPIREYSSLIWTERFFEDSEFQLISYDVAGILQNLPCGSFVSLRESKEVMRVESHNIETDETTNLQKITVKGKSLTSYRYHRTLGYRREKRYIMSRSYYSEQAALVILYNSFVNTQAYDLTRATAASYKDPDDAFPNTIITSTTTLPAGAVNKRWLAAGYIDEPLRRFLSRVPLGFRVVRPPFDTFKVLVDNAGVVTYNQIDPEGPYYPYGWDSLCFDIYEVEDRSHDNGNNLPVIFDTDMDDFAAPSYFEDVGNFKSVAHSVLESKSLYSYTDQPEISSPSTLSGPDRRVLFRDAGVPEDGFTQSEWDANVQEDAVEELQGYYKEKLMDGEISKTSQKQFKRDYNLGDTVSVRTPYLPMFKARVTEYIRSQENEEEIGYPTLTYL